MYSRLICFCISFLLFAIGCSPKSFKKIQLRNNSKDMQKEVANFISKGMPLLEARQILENNSFSCEDHKASVFSLQKRDEYERKLSEDIVKGDYLSCSITHSYFIASKTWQIFILYKNDTVVLTYAVLNHQNL